MKDVALARVAWSYRGSGCAAFVIRRNDDALVHVELVLGGCQVGVHGREAELVKLLLRGLLGVLGLPLLALALQLPVEHLA